eukprot:scaffold3210_cov113-Cylindrotheca_fusiformis.AAC.1
MAKKKMTGGYTLLLVTLLSSMGVSLAAYGDVVDFGMSKWVNAQKNGYFNPKLEIRTIPFTNGRMGIFAKEIVEEDEVIAHIPWSLIIGTDEEEDEDDDDTDGILDCGTVRNLANELKLGEKSDYAPYINYLLAQREGQIPSTWSEKGKELLMNVLGGNRGLPPSSAVDMLEVEWVEECKGDPTDPIAVKAAELVFSKNDVGLMVPLYDLIQHRNGEYTNTKTIVKVGKYHKTVASRPLNPGEQLYMTYDLCEDCDEEAVEQGYGTSEIFRDHGIIEEYPQRWTFQPALKIAEDDEGNMSSQSVEPPLTFNVEEKEDG